MSPLNGKTDEASFVFPVRVLESDRLKLVPVLSEEDWRELYEPFKYNPDVFNYLPFLPLATHDEFMDHYRKRFQANPGAIIFKCYNKTGIEESLCGVMALINTEALHQCTEIGYVITFPEFRRTHVTTHAVGLMMHYCLELPSAPISKNDIHSTNANDKRKPDQLYGPGLGLRRVQWQAHADNGPSVRLAERMGFQCEGIIRWQRTIARGKDEFGLGVPPERAAINDLPGRHSWMLSCCWDDWELEGARERVREQMDRLQ